SNQADIKLYIDNPEGQPAHTKFTIDSSFITIRHDRSALNETVPDHETLPAGLHFEDHTTRFRPAPVARYLFQQRGDAYDMGMENLTYDRLYELNSFRSVKIEYRKSDSNRLNAYYELIPRPYMGNQIEGEYTFNSGMSGFNIGNTFTHRNLFGGSEQLEVKL